MHKQLRLRGLASHAAMAIASVTAGVGAFAVPGAAQAQTAAENYSIPAGSLVDALRAYSERTGLQMIYSTEIVEGRTSQGVSGTMSRTEALARLLAGTGLTFRFNDNRTVLIEAASPGSAEGERVLGAVRVQGSQGNPYFGGAGQAAGVNGVNGSRDITATEGTGSFTSGALTIGSKVPQALKDVPQSLSVLTSERMEQQNVTDFTGAMRQLTGVALVQGDSGLESKFYSRGFEINSFSIDGGAPVVTSYTNNGNTRSTGFFLQLDLSIYDHVELLRGAAGTFKSFGDPSGTVNLVRKKPLDHAQLIVDMQTGSWNNYRAVLDGSVPLTADGRLRTRFVYTFQENDYFYKLAHDRKTLVYSITEYDLTPSTTLTGGVNISRQDSRPFVGGLMRYQNGADLGLPRNTSFVLPWNKYSFETTEWFGSIEQHISGDWTTKFNFTKIFQSTHQKAVNGFFPVNPYNGSGPTFFGIYQDYGSSQTNGELTASGSFKLFGDRQEVTFGVNRAFSSSTDQYDYAELFDFYARPYQPYPGGPTFCEDFGSGTCPDGSINRIPLNPFTFNPYDPIYAEPQSFEPKTHFIDIGQIVTTAYANLRLTMLHRFHVVTGMRWSQIKDKTFYDELCTKSYYFELSCAPKNLSVGEVWNSVRKQYTHSYVSWPPTASLSFDITKELLMYGGYTDINEAQSSYLDKDLRPLDPITGSNLELGFKWAPKNQRLNASVAFYKIRKRGFAAFDLGSIKRNPDGSIFFDVEGNYYFINSGGDEVKGGNTDSNHSCCMISDKNREYSSKGIDIDVSGEVVPGVQAAIGLTYNENKNVGSAFGPNNGKPMITITPKYLYKAWFSYTFSDANVPDWLKRLSVAGGVNGQSSGYRQGGVCVNLLPPTTGSTSSNCKSYSAPDYVDYAFVVPPYAVFSARLDYKVSRNISASLNVENIMDKTYYQSTGGVENGSWYGAPRSFTASLRGKF